MCIRDRIDGGITPATAPQVLEMGADCLIAGTAVFGAPDYAKAISALRVARPKEQPEFAVNAG